MSEIVLDSNRNMAKMRTFDVISDKFNVSVCVNKKATVIPLQALSGPEVSRRLRILEFKTIDI
jgi:hypothetical protein